MVDQGNHLRAVRPSSRTQAETALPFRVYIAFVLGAVFLTGLFWLTWKSQFAAPLGYLFDTPSEGVEAGYCLAVARTIAPGGGGGGYVGEAQDFWLNRLMGFGGDLAGNIAKGEAALGSHLLAKKGPERLWLIDAMDACSNKAINYGARFRAFD
ncbi:hypothetical protein [Thioclava pacifica]|uniref:Uncharacterized protein n=1 Tax=Thioclava pacifica DSM 10166 TaxID=1353537 RepID=A0A074JJT6_9RHOB|nr:hypothetical protein [Thioclava pacifica]KEO56100.1 hypothetical protein TP2_00845 [Thioclava pacifica DSM 10166]